LTCVKIDAGGRRLLAQICFISGYFRYSLPRKQRVVRKKTFRPVRRMSYKSTHDRILALLENSELVLGLRLCFHDNTGRSGLPPRLRMHSDHACSAVKQRHEPQCLQFDIRQVPRLLRQNPEGSIHSCPFGHVEIAVSVFSDGLPAGTLFAGPCWTSSEVPPHPALIVPPAKNWLESRQVLLRAVATELGVLLDSAARAQAPCRRDQVLEFLNSTIRRRPSLEQLAEVLALSPSRTGHLVRELFGLTFPQLINETKARRAAELLASTDWQVGRIAREVGFADQNYLSRVFSSRYGCCPRAYRKRCGSTG